MVAVRALRRRATFSEMSHLWRRALQQAQTAPTFARFVIAGTAGYLVYQAVLFFGQSASLPLLPPPDATVRLPLLVAPDARLLAATLVAAEASILAVFCIHGCWTFRERSATGSRWRRLTQFHVKSAVSTFGILTVGVNVLSGHFDVEPYLAATLGTLVAFIWNWFWDSRVIWGRSRKRAASASAVRLILARTLSRFRSAVPYALAAVLAFLAVGLWGYLIVRVIDDWDGDGADQREDVVAFYAAGSLVRDDLGDSLYEPDAVAAREREILGRPAGLHNGLVYLNPPFVAGLFEPLAHLPYGRAQALWFALSALAVFASVALLLPELRRLPRRWALVFVLAALASFPVFWSLLYGQLSSLVLLSWVLFYRLLKDGREGPAGLVLAASLIKPHLALVPIVYLVATRRWRALAGYAVGAAILGAASVALVGPEVTFVSYPALILESLSWQAEYGVDRAHMYGWASFLNGGLPGRLAVDLPAAVRCRDGRHADRRGPRVAPLRPPGRRLAAGTCASHRDHPHQPAHPYTGPADPAAARGAPGGLPARCLRHCGAVAALLSDTGRGHRREPRDAGAGRRSRNCRREGRGPPHCSEIAANRLAEGLRGLVLVPRLVGSRTVRGTPVVAPTEHRDQIDARRTPRRCAYLDRRAWFPSPKPCYTREGCVVASPLPDGKPTSWLLSSACRPRCCETTGLATTSRLARLTWCCAWSTKTAQSCKRAGA